MLCFELLGTFPGCNEKCNAIWIQWSVQDPRRLLAQQLTVASLRGIFIVITRTFTALTYYFSPLTVEIKEQPADKSLVIFLHQLGLFAVLHLNRMGT